MTGAREKWDKIYGQQRSEALALDTLREHDYLLPKKGNALDLACGRAGNAEFLVRHGLQVSAWDISAIVIAQVAIRFANDKLQVDAQARDVTVDPPLPESFDVIVVSRFLERSLANDLVAALRPGGVLIYQTFVKDKVADVGPSNPEYLLDKNELLKLFSALTVRVFFDLGSCGDSNRGIRNESLLIAQKPRV